MWLFTRYGFYSAVCAREGDGEYGQPVDTDRIMVRARMRPHLEALQERFPRQLGACAIHESFNADYAYRLFVPKSAWVQVLAGLGEETDYDNFKSEVAQFQGKDGVSYEDALHRVWEVMLQLQHKG